ncbi:MAG: SAM-dependent methyltransferase [Verrucomicrobia bacterium]|nr:SAM-dependent methyltransferase [Cytophagales bacterium]
MTKTGTLFLIPTTLAPDTAEYIISPQIKEIITKTDYFFAENIRTTRRFISELKLGKKIEDLHFFELNKDTSTDETEKNIDLLLNGHDIGLLSEAGSPGIADPGAVAVALAHQKNIPVMALAGPSAILMALMGSGMNGQSFVFHGYLPIEKTARLKMVLQLETDAYKKNQTQIFMETPFRNNQLLQEIIENCQSQTKLCLACNLTAQDELLKTKTISQWKTQMPDLHKKPTIFLIFR